MVNEEQLTQVNFNEKKELFYQKLGKALRLERIRNGKTQSQIASVANVTFQQIQKYEKAKNECGEFRARKIVESYGRRYEDFLNEYDVHTS